MMTKDEALKMAIEALEEAKEQLGGLPALDKLIQECKEALATNKESSLVQTEQEPVAWLCSYGKWNNTYVVDSLDKMEFGHEAVPLYTHPHQWQGLTAEEIASIPLDEHTVQTVEKILKEKNHE